jgi:tetratricopeptide (TPR) repeat protein
MANSYEPNNFASLPRMSKNNEWQQQAAECLAQDKYAEAIALYEQCIEANPNDLYNYWRLGLALLLVGKESEAQTVWYSAILQLALEEFEAGTEELIRVLEAEGCQRLQSGQFNLAEKISKQIIEQDSTNIEAWKNLGNALYKQEKLDEALDCYQQALSLETNAPTLYYQLGLVLQKQGKLDEAIANYQQCIAFNPNQATAYYNLGYALQTQGKLDEAIDCYQQALTLEPNFVLAYQNLGATLHEKGEIHKAITCYERLLEIAPDYAEAYYNLACLVQGIQLEKSIAFYSRAIELDPEHIKAHLNLSFILLLLGKYKEGFAEYEWRWRRESTPPRHFPQPLWDGSNLEGRIILLHSEQGLGDTIQFIRYAPLVQARGGRVLIECQQPLVRLLKTVAGIEKVVPLGTTLPEFDVHAPLLSLPHILGTTLETVPAQIPYLKPPQHHSLRLDRPPGACLQVGIVWAGNPDNRTDKTRSCSLNYFLALLNIPGIAFYSLQKGVQAGEIAHLPSDVSLQDLSGQLNDFADTAVVVTQLDLIITVDTAVAHLAGALGRPVWVLLSHWCDWRWIIDREDSPWYPTIRLFRQHQSGDWAGVFARVAEALVELIS